MCKGIVSPLLALLVAWLLGHDTEGSTLVSVQPATTCPLSLLADWPKYSTYGRHAWNYCAGNCPASGAVAAGESARCCALGHVIPLCIRSPQLAGRAWASYTLALLALHQNSKLDSVASPTELLLLWKRQRDILAAKGLAAYWLCWGIANVQLRRLCALDLCMQKTGLIPISTSVTIAGAELPGTPSSRAVHGPVSHANTLHSASGCRLELCQEQS